VRSPAVWPARPVGRLLFCLLLAVPVPAAAAGVQARFGLESPAAGPFPSDVFTVADDRHLTGRRVNVPLPDCRVRPTDCADLEVINTLDGFNLQPRLSIPFSGPIDLSTVDSGSVFLAHLGHIVDGAGSGRRVGVNQIVWDAATTTLHLESDELLDQHTRYALIVTDGVRDVMGDPVEAGPFSRFRLDLNFGHRNDRSLKAYRVAVLEALARAGVTPTRVVAASVFTTLSATAVLEKIRAQIKALTPAPASFLLGARGERTVFPLGDLRGITFNRQVSEVGFLSRTEVPLAALRLFPGVGAAAFGRYESPDYGTVDRFIPPVGTRLGVPAVQRTNALHFTLILPAGLKPPAGWPVAIFGHGFGDNKNNSPFAVANTMAAYGIATIAINVVGHGGGPAGTLVVSRRAGGPVTLPAGGRGIDQDGDGTIGSTEGVNAAPPLTLISNRDGLRQTVVDLMQLARVIETGGVDADGDGFPDLDGARIYYVGQSFGGIYGTIFLGVEPGVRAGVLNVPGGPIIEIARLSPVFRDLVTMSLAARVPPLLNVFPIAAPLLGFNENLPLRDQPPVINTVPGALAIQEFIERAEWASQSGSPVAYGRHIRKDPLDGVPAKSVIYQFAKGDQTVPNPTTTSILRAGDLADRATYFRNDEVAATIPGAPANPHTFLLNLGVPAVAGLAVAAQGQVAMFFVTDGTLIIDPDGAAPFFEVPIAGPLPEALNF
jgi:hypothetical protein